MAINIPGKSAKWNAAYDAANMVAVATTIATNRPASEGSKIVLDLALAVFEKKLDALEVKDGDG